MEPHKGSIPIFVIYWPLEKDNNERQHYSPATKTATTADAAAITDGKENNNDDDNKDTLMVTSAGFTYQGKNEIILTGVVEGLQTHHWPLVLLVLLYYDLYHYYHYNNMSPLDYLEAI